MLEKYAADNGFMNILFLSDDGYSGTNFDIAILLCRGNDRLDHCKMLQGSTNFLISG